MNLILILPVALPLALALVCWAAGKKGCLSWPVYLSAVAVFAAALLCAVQGSGTLEVGELCALGLHFQLDGFRGVYLAVMGLMWMMSLFLSPEYLAHHHNHTRYYVFSLVTLSAIMGLFLAADLFTAFVFFEIMSLASYVWVAQEETAGALRAGDTYLAVSVIGGLVALMGVFLIHHLLGSTELDTLFDLARACPKKGGLYAAGGCILFGFGAKAGMFPLHIWLPKAHPVAPAPASALLSGALTKAGVWGILAISCNLFRHDPVWGWVMLSLGTVTMVLGAVLALFSIDLKRTLACSSMSQIGFILVGVGMMGLLGEENGLAARGVILHMVNHSLFKLVLFLCAAVVYQNAHSLDLNDIRGFGRKKPLLGAAFLLGALGIGGVPGFSGYVSKTLLHESIVEFGSAVTAVEWLFLLSGGLTVAYMTKLFVAIFLEKNPRRQAEFDRMGRYVTPLGAVTFALPALALPVLGLLPHATMDRAAELAMGFFHGGELHHAVHYFAWANLKGAVISIAIGGAVYALVVRRWMVKNGCYVNRWPRGLDLEERLYRPLLLGAAPRLIWLVRAVSDLPDALFARLHRLTGLVRAVSDLPDALAALLMATVLRESRWEERDEVTGSLAYRLGEDVDVVEVRRGHEGAGEHRYAHLFFRTSRTVSETTHRITGSLSFALLMMCAAICAVFVYLKFV